jgi:hypothetical protein
MAYGALTVPDISTPGQMVESTGTSMVVMDNDSQGNIQPQSMNPMESMMMIFEEIRDGINTLVDLAYTGAKVDAADMKDEAIEGADADLLDPDSQGNDPVDDGGGGFGFKIPKPGPKLGLALLMGGLATLLAFGDKLVPIIAPVLKAIKENILPNVIDFFKDFYDSAVNLFTSIKEKVATIFGGKNPDGSDATILDRLTAVGDIFKDFAGFILNIGNSLITNVLEMFGVNFEPYDSVGAWVLGKLNDMWTGITTFFTDAGTFVVEGVTGAYDYVKQKIMGAFTAIGKWFSDAGTFVIEGVTGVYDFVSQKVSGAFSSAKEFFSETGTFVVGKFTGAYDFVSKKVSGAFTTVSDWFSKTGEFLLGSFNSIVDWIADKLKVPFAFLTDLFSFPESPKEFATKFIDLVLLPYNLAIKFIESIFGFSLSSDDEEFSLGTFIVDKVLDVVKYLKELFNFDLPSVGEMLKGAGDIIQTLLRAVLPSPDFLTFDTPSVTLFGKKFGGGTISLNPIPDALYKAAGIDPETGEDLVAMSDGDTTLVTGSSVQTETPTNGAELSEGSKENAGGTVVTTINTTDASQTNQSTSNTTQTPGLSVEGTDQTAKYLAAAYG